MQSSSSGAAKPVLQPAKLHADGSAVPACAISAVASACENDHPSGAKKRRIEQSDADFTEVQNKNSKKTQRKEERNLDLLKAKLCTGATGVFKIKVRKAVSTAESAEAKFSSKEQIVVLKTMHAMFPEGRWYGGDDFVSAWISNVTDAKKLLAITLIEGILVSCSCPSLSGYRAVITQVCPSFSDEDILTELSEYGVVSVSRKGRGSAVSRGTTVQLTFSDPPPESVFLVHRNHRVTIEVPAPLLCYKCQRLGHFAASCRLRKVCRNCGSPDHVLAACKNQPKCVNCSGLHASGAQVCPRIFLARERSRLFVEARLVQQVQQSAPTGATVRIVEDSPKDSKAERVHGTQPSGSSDVQVVNKEGEDKRSYAAVTRVIQVTQNESSKESRINLPAESSFPKESKKTRRRRMAYRRAKVVKKSANSSGQRSTPLSKGGSSSSIPSEADLLSVAAILEPINKDAAEAIRGVAKLLGPLIKLLPLLNTLGSVF